MSEVLERKRAEMTARITLAPKPLQARLDELEAAPEMGSQGYSVEGVQFADGRIAWRLYDDATGQVVGEYQTEQDAERAVARERPLTLTA